VIYRSFKAGNLKHLDMDLFRALNSAIAKRMYRFHDKRFYHGERFESDLHKFAFEKAGLSRQCAKNAAKIREKLGPAIEELETSGYLRPLKPNERYVQMGRGNWKVVFFKNVAAAQSADAPEEETPTLAAELVARGVAKKVAASLVKKHLPDKIQEKIEVHDWLVAKRDKRIGENPAGFVASAIRDDYPAPKGFETKAQAEAKRLEALERKRLAEAAARSHVERQTQLSDEQERPVRDYLAALSAAELAELEAEAVAQADKFKRGLYEKSKKKGGSSFETYRETILFDYVEGLLSRQPGDLFSAVESA
jgi:hypothetical protein